MLTDKENDSVLIDADYKVLKLEELIKYLGNYHILYCTCQ